MRDVMEESKGGALVDSELQIGAGGSKAAFMHPKAAKTLLEFAEH